MMLVQYENETGLISQIVYHPAPPELADILEAQGTPFLKIMGERTPEEPVLDPLTGLPRFGENGEPLVSSNGTIFPLVDSLTHYVEDGMLKLRPAFDKEATLSLVVGQSVTLDFGRAITIRLFSQVQELSDGLLELEGEEPAIYTLYVYSWPYQDFQIEVTVDG